MKQSDNMVWFAYTANPHRQQSVGFILPDGLASKSAKHSNINQVRCGSVYVTSDDTAQQVTSNILSATCLAEKKKRGHKFTVAVGTTHGHVQAFLSDGDKVLSALDACNVDEKCLMLIKRPKTSAKQMLKAHSWANLSVSDSHLNRPLDGGFSTTKHSKHKWRRRTDEQSVMSEGDIMADIRDGFNKENIQQRNMRRAVVPPMVNGTNSLDRHAPNHPDFHKMRSPEINNNHHGNLGNNRDVYMYHSCLDISSYPMPTVHETEAEQNGRLNNDQLYSRPENVNSSTDADVSRAQSLGDLTQGLSLTAVSDRMSGSMMNLSNMPAPRARRRNRTPGGSNNERYNTLEVFQEIPEHYSQKSNPSSHNYNSVKGGVLNNGEMPEHYSQKLTPNTHNYSSMKGGLPDNGCEIQEHYSQKSNNYNSTKGSPSDVIREQSPLKKRSLPQVPPVEANERIKRFTEMMKARMSVSSSNGYRTSSENSCYSEHGVGILSQTRDTPSDNEVFELLQTASVKSSPLDAKNFNKCNSSQSQKDSGVKNSYSDKSKSYSYSQNTQHTPLPPGDRSGDSGQITLLSHCSTVDSGYTTNNDCDVVENGQSCKTVPSYHRDIQNYQSSYPAYSTPKKSYDNYSAVISPNHRRPVINGHQKQPLTENPKTPTTPRNLKIETLPNQHRWNDAKNNTQQRRSLDPANSRSTNDQPVSLSREKHSTNVNGYVKSSGPNQESEEFASSTLPGHWRYPSSSENQPSPPLGSPTTGKYPTMFQLSQTYDFHPVRISLPSVTLLIESMELRDVLVDLPDNSSPDSSPCLPQGRYARLGGPGSAFRPVRPASITPAVGRLVAVGKLTDDIRRACIVGEMKEGDILIEMNSQLLLGTDVSVVKKSLEVCQGDITLTVGRIKRPIPVKSIIENPAFDNLNGKVKELEMELKKLKTEMKNKDMKIQQLTSDLSPSKVVLHSPPSPVSEIGLPNFDNFVISEDEFIV